MVLCAIFYIIHAGTYGFHLFWNVIALKRDMLPDIARNPADFDILHVDPDVMQPVNPSGLKAATDMQVSGGSQDFNAVNQMGVLGRWMRMVTIPNQSSVAKAWLEFDDNDCMKASPYYNRIVDVTEELVKFTWMTRMRTPYLVDRYSERAETRAQVHERVSKK